METNKYVDMDTINLQNQRQLNSLIGSKNPNDIKTSIKSLALTGLNYLINEFSMFKLLVSKNDFDESDMIKMPYLSSSASDDLIIRFSIDESPDLTFEDLQKNIVRQNSFIYEFKYRAAKAFDCQSTDSITILNIQKGSI